MSWSWGCRACYHPRVQGATEPFSEDPWEEVRPSWVARPELEELLAWWRAGASEPIVVEGMAGSGKTLLLRVFGREVARELDEPDAVHMHSLAWLRSLRLESVPDPEELVSQLPRRGRALIALDETDLYAIERVVALVERMRALRPATGVVLATRDARNPGLPAGGGLCLGRFSKWT